MSIITANLLHQPSELMAASTNLENLSDGKCSSPTKPRNHETTTVDTIQSTQCFKHDLYIDVGNTLKPSTSVTEWKDTLQILVATATLLSALLRHSCYSAEAFSSLGAPNARTRKMAPTGNEEDAKKAQQKDRKRGEPTTSSAPISRMVKSPHCEMRFRGSERNRELDLGCCKDDSLQNENEVILLHIRFPIALQVEILTVLLLPYIVTGPQCCGKSSFLREFEGLKIKDICLDDQSDVYVPVSTQTFLRAYDEKNHDAAKVDEEAQSVLQQVYQGKTLLERIRENIELILILRRWNGDSSAEDFGRRIRSFYKERNFTEDVAEALIRAKQTSLY
eukprot:jgi/Psemu1/60151/gm1.60151_g